MEALHLCRYTYQYFMNLQQRQTYQRKLCGACYDQRFPDFACADQMGTLIQPDLCFAEVPADFAEVWPEKVGQCYDPKPALKS